jgi:hypothetical protein
MSVTYRDGLVTVALFLAGSACTSAKKGSEPRDEVADRRQAITAGWEDPFPLSRELQEFGFTDFAFDGQNYVGTVHAEDPQRVGMGRWIQRVDPSGEVLDLPATYLGEETAWSEPYVADTTSGALVAWPGTPNETGGKCARLDENGALVPPGVIDMGDAFTPYRLVSGGDTVLALNYSHATILNEDCTVRVAPWPIVTRREAAFDGTDYWLLVVANDTTALQRLSRDGVALGAPISITPWAPQLAFAGGNLLLALADGRSNVGQNPGLFDSSVPVTYRILSGGILGAVQTSSVLTNDRLTVTTRGDQFVIGAFEGTADINPGVEHVMTLDASGTVLEVVDHAAPSAPNGLVSDGSSLLFRAFMDCSWLVGPDLAVKDPCVASKVSGGNRVLRGLATNGRSFLASYTEEAALPRVASKIFVAKFQPGDEDTVPELLEVDTGVGYFWASNALVSNGTDYLVAGEDEVGDGVAQRVSEAGTILDPSPFPIGPGNIMAGTSNGSDYLLVLASRVKLATQFVRVSAKGAVLDATPVDIDGRRQKAGAVFTGSDYLLALGGIRLGRIVRVSTGGSVLSSIDGPNAEQVDLAWGEGSGLLMWTEATASGAGNLVVAPIDATGTIGQQQVVEDVPDSVFAKVAWDGTMYRVVWTERRGDFYVPTSLKVARVTAQGQVLDPGGVELATGLDWLNPLVASSRGRAAVAYTGLHDFDAPGRTNVFVRTLGAPFEQETGGTGGQGSAGEGGAGGDEGDPDPPIAGESAGGTGGTSSGGRTSTGGRTSGAGRGGTSSVGSAGKGDGGETSGGTGTAGRGGRGGSGNAAGSDNSGGDAGTGRPSRAPSDDAGCACRIGRTNQRSELGWAALLVAGALARRRRLGIGPARQPRPHE